MVRHFHLLHLQSLPNFYLQSLLLLINAAADDLNVLTGKALYTQRFDVLPRTARFQRSKCFSAKKLTSYSDRSALAVSHVTYTILPLKCNTIQAIWYRRRCLQIFGIISFFVAHRKAWTTCLRLLRNSIWPGVERATAHMSDPTHCATAPQLNKTVVIESKITSHHVV